MSCQITDPCILKNCIENIKGLPSNSASPTEQLLLTFKDNTIYLDPALKIPIKIKNAFMKLFIEPESWKNEYRRTHADELKIVVDQFIEENIIYLKGLIYEHKIYKYITTPLIDNKICPHFVRYYMGSNKDCDLDTIGEFLLIDKSIDIESAKRNFYYMFYFAADRPSINENDDMYVTEYEHPIPASANLKINYIITQAVSSTTITFEDYLNNYQRLSIDNQTKNAPILFTLLFQIALACYAMELSKMTHNDLHTENIWISTISNNSTGKNIGYSIEDNDYGFKNVKSKAKIYDFDRAFCENLGINELLDTDNCIRLGHCNKLLHGKDFAKIMCYFISRNILPSNLVLSWFIQPTYIIDWSDLYKNPSNDECFLNNKFPDRNYTYILDYPTILYNLYMEYKKYGGEDLLKTGADIVYRCDTSRFLADGSIKNLI
jgi:hypothetical protein